MIGPDVIVNIIQMRHGGLDDPKYRPAPLLKQVAAAGYLGWKTGRGFSVYQE